MTMSYNLSLHCGCIVYVSCHPQTRVAHTRIIQSRGVECSWNLELATYAAHDPWRYNVSATSTFARSVRAMASQFFSHLRSVFHE
jgi:hypothetical protein